MLTDSKRQAQGLPLKARAGSMVEQKMQLSKVPSKKKAPKF